MSETNVDDSCPTRTYQQVFIALRERAGLTQEALAGHLGVEAVIIEEIEGGARPPRRVTFYEKLREVPGYTKEDMVTLLRTSDGPQWLIKDAEPNPSLLGTDKKVAEVVVEVRLQVDERLNYSREDAIAALEKLANETTLRLLLEHDNDRYS